MLCKCISKRALLLCALTLTFAATASAQCLLTDVRVSFPRRNSTVVLSSTSNNMRMALAAYTNCASGTADVTFDLDGMDEGTATDAPFNVAPITGSQLTNGSHTVTATARQIGSAATQYTNSATFTVARASAAVDSNTNGYPDNPYTTLLGNGYTWLSQVPVEGSTLPRMVGVTRWAGSGGTSGTNYPVTITLIDPEDDSRRLTVEMPPELLSAGETGMLIVTFANDLETLLGDEEAALIEDEPSVGLVNGGQYADISIIISVDGGLSFDEIAPSRLAAHPIRVTMEGLSIASGHGAAFYSHPSLVDSVAPTGIELVAETGAWSSAEFSDTAVSSDRLSALMTSLSIIAPFNAASTEGEGEGEEGEGEGEAMLSPWLLAGVALGVGGLALGASGGDGGGGGPCFIATAAYGTPMDGSIDYLRLFRDTYLLDGVLGTAFVDSYYRISPFIADWIAAYPALAVGVRMMLWPVIFAARVMLAWPWVAPIALAAFLLLLLRRIRRADRVK